MAEYDSYIDSQIPYVGAIPSHWKTAPNKRVMHKEKRICDSYAGQDIISLTMKGAIVRDLGAGGKMPTTFDGYQFVYPGELLMCLFDIDVTPRCVGRVYNEGLTSPAYSSFVLHDNADLGYFFYYYLMLDHTKELLHLAKNLRHSLTEEQLGQIKVPLPPLEEQAAIATYLDRETERIDAIIAEAKASIEEYKEWKASIIYEAVTKGLDPNVEMKDSGVEWIGSIPSTWYIRKIKNVATTGSGGTPKSDIREYYDGGINWVCSLDLHEQSIFETKNTLSELGLKNCASEIRPAGTVVMAMYGGSGTIGKSGLLKNPSATNQAICCIMFGDKIVPDFGFYYIRAIRPYWMIYAVGTRKDPNISQAVVAEMPITIPAVSEQKSIVQYLDKNVTIIESLIAEKETLVAELESYKKSLIFEVVTGKRKVV